MNISLSPQIAFFEGVLCTRVPVAIPATCVFPSCCVIVATFALEVSGREMGGDGFQTQKSKSWIQGKDRAEKVLADAITIDGRKEWICKFCSETNVWTRWRRKRCYSNIPTGLRGKLQTGNFGKDWKVVVRIIVIK